MMEKACGHCPPFQTSATKPSSVQAAEPSSGGENTVFGHDVGLERVFVEMYSTTLRKKGHAGPALEEWICVGGALLERCATVLRREQQQQLGHFRQSVLRSQG